MFFIQYRLTIDAKNVIILYVRNKIVIINLEKFGRCLFDCGQRTADVEKIDKTGVKYLD